MSNDVQMKGGASINRLVISRKGFDSANGGCASPIFPDGTMLSLPIPSGGDPVTYADLRHGDVSIGDMVEDLTRGRFTRHDCAHLDPDVGSTVYQGRRGGCSGLFGQVGGSQTTLAKEGVGPGDLFLFFGWFRRVECVGGRWRYERGARDVHVLWGWLSVGSVREVADIPDGDPIRARVPRHPHFGYEHYSNTLYVADRGLGAGVFPRYERRLQLTDPGSLQRTCWRLPRWFYPFEPGRERPPLGYHGKRWRWSPESDVRLTSVDIGQEFVLDATAYPEAEEWALDLIKSLGSRSG